MARNQISAEVEERTKEHDTEEQAQHIDAAHGRALRRDHRARFGNGPVYLVHGLRGREAGGAVSTPV
eukprot:scaffold12242_cov180-Isochrysis_galbana.AAC.1